MSLNEELPTPVQIDVCSGSKLGDGIFSGQDSSKFGSFFRGPASSEP